jgi:hypothetical protein
MVVREWLYTYPKKRQRLLFLRQEGEPIQFGPSLKGLRNHISRIMRPNSLYLSAAAANNHPQLSRISDWFRTISPVRSDTDVEGSYTVHEWRQHDRDAIRSLLRYADTGVIDVKVEEEEVPQAAQEKFREFIQIYDPGSGGIDSDLAKRISLEFIHQGIHEDWPLTASEESSGTLAWLILVGPVAFTLRQGGILVVDELDANLHPLLAANLVNMFQDPASNPRGAQLIFNTHNATLLGPSSPGRLHRDQIWLADKSSSGVTSLLPLTEWKVRDGLENIEKRYLDGRYGAIPFLDDQALAAFRKSS